MSEEISRDRRRYLGAAVKGLAAAELVMIIEGGIGHNLPQEAPQAFAQAVVDVDGY